MTHIIVDDKFPDHPKAVGLSDAALACWLRGLCYSSRHLTDGLVSERARPTIGKPRAVAELVSRGLWEEIEGGWQIHDYGHIQRTKADLQAISETKAGAATLGNHKRWHLKRGIVADGCKWCRTPIAPAMPEGIAPESHTDRKASPEVQSNREPATEEVKPPGPFDRDASEGGGELVQAAIEIIIDEDVEQWGSTVNPRRIQREAHDLLAEHLEKHPDATTDDLVARYREVAA